MEAGFEIAIGTIEEPTVRFLKIQSEAVEKYYTFWILKVSNLRI